jgi:hypothetical protein
LKKRLFLLSALIKGFLRMPNSQNRAMGSTGHIFSGAAKGDPVQSGTAGRPQDNQIYLPIPGKADDFYKGNPADYMKFLIDI